MLLHWSWRLVQGTTERQKVGKSHWEAGCWVDLRAIARALNSAWIFWLEPVAIRNAATVPHAVLSLDMHVTHALPRPRL